MGAGSSPGPGSQLDNISLLPGTVQTTPPVPWACCRTLILGLASHIPRSPLQASLVPIPNRRGMAINSTSVCVWGGGQVLLQSLARRVPSGPLTVSPGGCLHDTPHWFSPQRRSPPPKCRLPTPSKGQNIFCMPSAHTLDGLPHCPWLASQIDDTGGQKGQAAGLGSSPAPNPPCAG